MPIYAYRCTECGHAQDILRKISDPPLTLCPACGKEGLVKQVTAAGFALKGTGWYVTDFRGGGSGANSGVAPAPASETTSTTSSSSVSTAAPSSPATTSSAPSAPATPSAPSTTSST